MRIIDLSSDVCSSDLQERLRQIGLSPESVSAQLQTLTQESSVTQVRDGIRTVEVVIRATEDERRALGNIGNAVIVTASGAPVPLSQVAKLVPVMEEPMLTRRNRESYIAVQSRSEEHTSELQSLMRNSYAVF